MVASLATDASRRAALLVAYILPVCALLAPCRAGASAPILGNHVLAGALCPMSVPSVASASEADVTAARERLDAHVRETVAWHFDPATGSPFWLEFASK